VIDNLTFTNAVWLFCPAFVLHVLEEWPRVTGWARLHASVRFTQRDYNLIHAAGIAASLLAALIVSRSNQSRFSTHWREQLSPRRL